MRPRRLTMKGFTCFRDETAVDFTGMEVFAITGRTGSGKTTIMDAMCYALYGRVPRGTDVGALVSRGAPQMSVSFEFEAADRLYRAGRRSTLNRTTGKLMATKVALEAQLADGEWEPLDDRVKEMNHEIEEILGLDFDGFQRCVLLPQGRFHEMLTGSADKRRQVLQDLLGINIYERLMKRANARASEADARAKALGEVLEKSLAGATEEALAAARAQLAAVGPKLEAARRDRGALQQAGVQAQEVAAARRAEREKTAQHEEIAARIERATKDSEGAEQELASLAGKIAAAEQELATIGYDGELHVALAGALVVAAQLSRLRAQATDAAARAADTAAAEAAAASAKDAEQQHIAARGAVAEAERVLEDARIAHSASFVQRSLKKGDTCPVCGGAVGKLPKLAAGEVERAQTAVQKARQAEQKLARTAADATKAAALAAQALDHARKTAAELAAQAAAAEADLGARLPDGVPSDEREIAARVESLESAKTRIEALRRSAERLATQRAQRAQALADAQSTVNRLLAEAGTLQRQAEADRERGDQAMAALREIVERNAWADVSALIEARKDPGRLLEQRRLQAQELCDGLGAEKGALEQRVESIAEQIERAKEHRQQLEDARKSGRLYHDLASLIGANFRNWLIGEAMTLLADAASRRLETLDNDRRYALRVEANEFRIVDHWEGDAERGADTLSGGETFLVSLALALALAEQLPRIQAEAGVALESLFLDEGFGSLDADTLEPVINALENLRQEGRMVGVITHVGDMASRIDRRIEVHKKQGGSTITVV